MPHPYGYGQSGLDDAVYAKTLSGRSYHPSAAKSHSALRPPRHVQQKIQTYQQRRLSQHQVSLTQMAVYLAVARPGRSGGQPLQATGHAARLGAMQRTQQVYRVPPVENAWTRRLTQSSHQGARGAKSKAYIYTGRGRGQHEGAVGEEQSLAAFSAQVAPGDVPLGYMVNFGALTAPSGSGLLAPAKKRPRPYAYNQDLTVDDLIEEYDAINYAKSLEHQNGDLRTGAPTSPYL